jgi:hypothetical protein
VQGIPAGAQVVAARVVVQVADASSGTWAVHAVLRPWSEA